VLFAYNGMVIGTYASAIPIIRERLVLSSLQLAGMFVLTGVFAVGSMQVCGRLADKIGARRLCLLMIVPEILAAIGYGLAPSYPLLLIAGALLGTGNGGIDVSMNALAVQVERHRLDRGKGTIMSFFHGTWAIGSLLGSLAVSVVGTVIKLPPVTTLITCALVVACLGLGALVVAWRITPETDVITHVDESGAKMAIPAAAYLMGAMAIAFGLAEGTASDWSANHVQQVAGVDPRTASWAFTVMMGCMVVIRLTGDFIVARIGRRRLVYIGGAIAAIGYISAASFSSFPILLVAWALVGLGAGVIAPQVYAIAGHTAGGRGLAVVVTFGYATFLMGPAIIGGLVTLFGIHHTMFIPGVLLLGLIPLARVALREPAATTELTDAGTTEELA
jgi:MFS family permease